MHPERFHSRPNGHPKSAQRVEVCDTIVVGRSRVAAKAGNEQEFEVVGIVEDPASSLRYAVCYCESADEFIVTDDEGALLSDEALAQEILEDFLEHAQGSTDEEDG